MNYFKSAIKSNSEGILEFLVQNGDINDGYLAFSDACENGELGVARYILEKCLNNELTHPQLYQIQQSLDHPLILATKNNHLDVVKLIVESGIYIDISDLDRKSALIHASKYGYLDIVEFLIDSGANVNFISSFTICPLSEACFEGHVDIVKILAKHGAKSDYISEIASKALEKTTSCEIARYFVKYVKHISPSDRVSISENAQQYVDIVKFLSK